MVRSKQKQKKKRKEDIAVLFYFQVSGIDVIKKYLKWIGLSYSRRLIKEYTFQNLSPTTTIWKASWDKNN